MSKVRALTQLHTGANHARRNVGDEFDAGDEFDELVGRGLCEPVTVKRAPKKASKKPAKKGG